MEQLYTTGSFLKNLLHPKAEQVSGMSEYIWIDQECQIRNSVTRKAGLPQPSEGFMVLYLG